MYKNTNGKNNSVHQNLVHTTALGIWENLINSQSKKNFDENRFGLVGYNINEDINQCASMI